MPFGSRSNSNSRSNSYSSKSYFPARSMSSAVHSFPSTSPVISPTPASSPSSPSFLSSIKDGFGLGVGVSIADRLTGSIFGPRTVNVQQIAPLDNCNNIINNYKTAVQNNTVTDTLQQEFNSCNKN